MTSTFKGRRAWPAIIVALILGPVAAMAYLRRGWLAVAYTIIPLLLIGLLIANQWLLPADLGALDALLLAGIAVYLLAVVHAGIIAIRGTVSPVPRWYGRWPAILVIATLPFIVLPSWRAFVFEPFTVPSSSMAPTLIPGDHVFANKAAYGYSRHSLPAPLPLPDNRLAFAPPKRGDLIAFRLPSNPSTHFINRVVGLPGDRLRMIDGTLYLNGDAAKQEALEPYTMPSCATMGGQVFAQYRETLPGGPSYRILDRGRTDMDNTEIFTVPDDHYFVLGDHRDNSIDSRFAGKVGMVHKRYLTGRIGTLYGESCDMPMRFSWRRVS